MSLRRLVCLILAGTLGAASIIGLYVLTADLPRDAATLVFFGSFVAFCLLIPALRHLRVFRILTSRGRALERFEAAHRFHQQTAHRAALAQATQAVALDPQLAAAYLLRGAALFHLQRLEEALADFDAVVRLDPACADAHAWRSVVCRGLGRADIALQAIDQALQLDPENAAHLLERTMVHWARGDLDNALADVSIAILANPNDASCLYTRGAVLLHKGECDRAIHHFSELLRAGVLSRAVLLRERGTAWHFKNEYARAVLDFDESLALNPDDALALNNRGAARWRRQEYALACADLTEALQLNPRLANAHRHLAWILATCPRPDIRSGHAAIDHARQAMELVRSPNAECFAVLAAAHAESGNFDEALLWQRRCVDAAPAAQVEEMNRRLALYRARKPCHDPLCAPPPALSVRDDWQAEAWPPPPLPVSSDAAVRSVPVE